VRSSQYSPVGRDKFDSSNSRKARGDVSPPRAFPILHPYRCRGPLFPFFPHGFFFFFFLSTRSRFQPPDPFYAVRDRVSVSANRLSFFVLAARQSDPLPVHPAFPFSVTFLPPPVSLPSCLRSGAPTPNPALFDIPPPVTGGPHRWCDLLLSLDFFPHTYIYDILWFAPAYTFFYRGFWFPG